ncbi:MAG: glycosyltransferase family 4 protein, partial [Planctomycetes bacterium]|nr:glycosyltransferase family 4 protein [Planctomycetota bacterium]
AAAVGSDGTPLISRLARRHFGHNAALDAWIRQHARPERFDVALLNGAVLGQQVSAFGVPVVWNPQDELVLPTVRDAQFGGWRSWPLTLRRLALYVWFEREVSRRAAATVYVSKIDAAYARRWSGAACVEVVQNGVDLDYFRPPAEPPQPGTLVFVGSLEFGPNVDGVVHFVRRIWPRIQAGGVGRKLLIVGRRPVAEVRALASAPGVELAADVPDVRPYLSRAAVVVVPMRKGAGLKNKILEGCAMKRPVVASPRALGGLSARPGLDVLCAAEPRQWVERVGRLLDRSQYAARIARNGHDWVRRTHCWSVTGRRFYEILAWAHQSFGRNRSNDAGQSFGNGARLRKRLSTRTSESEPTRCPTEPKQCVGEALASACKTGGGPMST